jgi:hypothetical protein
VSSTRPQFISAKTHGNSSLFCDLGVSIEDELISLWARAFATSNSRRHIGFVAAELLDRVVVSPSAPGNNRRFHRVW